MFELMSAIVKSCSHACEGILFVARLQRNFRIHLMAAVAALAAGILAGLTRLEMAVLIVTVLGVVCGELFNSALEYALDLLEKRHHPVAKAAKDIAAGAVLMAVAGSVAVGLLLFWPRLWELF